MRLTFTEVRPKGRKQFFGRPPFLGGPPPTLISRSGSGTAYATRTELNLVCDAMLQAVSFFFLAKLLHANVVFACKPPTTSRVFSRTVLISCCNIFICNRAGWDKNKGTGRILRGKADCKQSTVTQDWRMDCGLGPGGVLPY